MVHPRYEYNVGEVVRQSFDSYNQPVQPRGQGEEDDVKIPDIIVVKGSATLTDDSDDVVARMQLSEYMGTFSDKFGNVKFKVALVQGSKVSI